MCRIRVLKQRLIRLVALGCLPAAFFGGWWLARARLPPRRILAAGGLPVRARLPPCRILAAGGLPVPAYLVFRSPEVWFPVLTY